MSPLRDRGERASLQITWQSDTHAVRDRYLARAVDLVKRNAICLDRKRESYNITEDWKEYVLFHKH